MSNVYEDFELELEAIQSMYDGVIVIDPTTSSSSSSSSSPSSPSSSSSSSLYYRIIELTLLPRILASSSLVEVTLHIHVPLSYITHDNDGDDKSFIPKVVIVRTSGLSDEGRQLLLTIQKLHTTFLPGDQVLYQLIEAAYEYLDSVNEGECLICTDTLAVPSSLTILSSSSLSPSCLYSLRIPSCYHCYHVSCLCKWAAITMTTGKNKKELQNKEDNELNAVRVIRKEVDSTTVIITGLESDLVNLGNERLTILSKLQKDENKKQASSTKKASVLSSSSSVKSNIKVLREKLAVLISKTQKEKNENTRYELRLEADLLRVEITKEEENELLILNSKDDDEKYKNLLEKIDRTISDTNDKITKSNKRRHQLEAQLKQAMYQYDNFIGNRYSSIFFRCPTCRKDLTPADCFPQDKGYFEAEVFREMSLLADDNDTATTISSTSGSVFLLPLELQEYVTKIQKQQRDMIEK